MLVTWGINPFGIFALVSVGLALNSGCELWLMVSQHKKLTAFYVVSKMTDDTVDYRNSLSNVLYHSAGDNF